MDGSETLRIDAIATGGDGVGRLEDGRVVFVPRTAPGDVVTIRLVEQSRRMARGELESLEEAGPSRVEPRCPVYAQCGGCALQHLALDAQLEVKRRIVEDHLVRPGWVSPDRIGEPRPSPEPWEYRVRMRYHVHRGEVGLYRRGSRALVRCDECAIAAPALREALARAIPVLETSLVARFDIEAVVTEGGVELLLVGDARDRGALESLAERCLALDGVDAVSVAAGAGRWTSRADPAGAPPVGSFRQANPGGNEILHELVAAALPPGPDPVLELFAGSGNFGFALARAGHPVVAVENDAAAVAAGRAQAERSGLPVRFHAVGATRFLRGDDAWAGIELVLVNPPRSGLPAAVPSLLAGGAMRRLVYVSCQPATLGRDLARFLDEGLRVERVDPVDLFPQTAHVECVAILERP